MTTSKASIGRESLEEKLPIPRIFGAGGGGIDAGAAADQVGGSVVGTNDTPGDHSQLPSAQQHQHRGVVGIVLGQADVGPAAERHRAVEHQVVAVVAGHDVRSQTADDDVVARAAVEKVVAGVARHQVVAR